MPGADFVLDKGFVAQSALTQYTAVKFGTAEETCTAVTGATDVMIGVTQQTVSAADATIGRMAVDVRMLGITKVVAGGTVTRGTRMAFNASGQAVTAGATGTRLDGIFMTSGVSGDWVDVFLTPGGQVV
jgi:hypothetical protein